MAKKENKKTCVYNILLVRCLNDVGTRWRLEKVHCQRAAYAQMTLVGLRKEICPLPTSADIAIELVKDPAIPSERDGTDCDLPHPFLNSNGLQPNSNLHLCKPSSTHFADPPEVAHRNTSPGHNGVKRSVKMGLAAEDRPVGVGELSRLLLDQLHVHLFR